MSRFILRFCCLLLFTASAIAQPHWYGGGDLSTLLQWEQSGAVYRIANARCDPVAALQSNGMNLVRLRLWHTPALPWNGLDSTIVAAKRMKRAGLSVLLDIHYSDSWADPGQQTLPVAWQNCTFPSLCDSVYQYTYSVLTCMRADSAAPDLIQIGNEITNGMLWNWGRVDGSWNTVPQWNQFTQLLRVADSAVWSAFPANRPRTVIHIDRSGNEASMRAFYDSLLTHNVRFDIIGLSYYPWWHGSLDQLRTTLTTAANRYRKPILIAETAYPFTLAWSDTTFNLVGQSSQLLPEFDATPLGQRAFLDTLCTIVAATPNGLGMGVCWWEPAWTALSNPGSPWENLCLFDYFSNLLPAASVYNRYTSVTEPTTAPLPSSLQLRAYPNPFNSSVAIRISLTRPSTVNWSIWSVTGTLVASGVTNIDATGEKLLVWNGRATGGSPVASGKYYLTVTAGQTLQSIPIVFVK